MADDIDQLLHIIRQTCVAEIRSDQPDLNLRQFAVLLLIDLTDEPQTVRGLAAHLNVAKPAITRAIDRLEELELARREPDGRDRRSIIVRRTARGAAMVERLQVAMAQAADVNGKTLKGDRAGG